MPFGLSPLVAYAIEALVQLVRHVPECRLLSFILLPLILIAFAVGTGALMRRVMPGVYGILTGGRGM